MKLRDSGMPDEPYWESLFDVGLILSKLGIGSSLGDIAELGCGHGTFTVPVARAVSGTVFAFDIDPAMIVRTRQRCRLAQLKNVVCQQRDVMEQGFDLPGKVDGLLLFNILHCEHPQRLLKLAAEVVRGRGQIFVIHWRFDASTPRGPALEIRPRPEQIVRWSEESGLLVLQGETIDLPPWHYGLRFARV